MSDLLALSAQHRDLWREAHQRPDLKRILDAEVDLLACPMTVAEREFLNTVVVHFNTGWCLAREGALLELDTLAGDAREFFHLPLPKAAWNETRTTRDQAFVRFIEDCAGRENARTR